MRYDIKMCHDYAARLVSFGFRVWLSSKVGASHGFYSDDDGARVCTFQTTGGQVRFSGNYHASHGCGSGWCIEEHAPTDKLMARDFLHAFAPHWANPSPSYTTVSEHLANYGQSSKYERFEQ